MNTTEFIAEIAPMAVADMMQSNVLASITIAQGIEESASGNHAPGQNLFGIKSTVEGTGQLLWTQEYVNGEWIQIQDWFRVYPDWSGSIADHSDFLIRNERYARFGFFEACNALDYKSAAQALQDAGYATNPSYAANLIGIIQTYKLFEYDQEAVNNLQRIDDLDSRLKVVEAKLAKTAPPVWFVNEFGAHSLDGIVNDLTGDEEFWRDVAVELRLQKK